MINICLLSKKRDEKYFRYFLFSESFCVVGENGYYLNLTNHYNINKYLGPKCLEKTPSVFSISTILVTHIRRNFVPEENF